MHLISVLTFAPLALFCVILLSPRSAQTFHKWSALIGSTAIFVLSLLLITRFIPNAGMQFVERFPLIRMWGIEYFMGVDGISLFIIILTTFLTPIVILSSFKSIEKHTREYFALLMLLETGMIGSLAALDGILFYVFWELMLIPMFFIIGVWGGPRKIYATIKFVIFTLAGSLLMLVGIMVLAYMARKAGSGNPFALTEWLKLGIPFHAQCWLFGAFALAFAVKVPMFPLHTWLPDAHVEAPTGGSVILAGVLLKMGVYGFLRFAFPLFPEASRYFAPLFIGLSIIGIIYGAFMALAQDDVKKLVAYSSVSHMGAVMLGLFTFSVTGVQGALFLMISHGLSTSGLFLIIGVIYERRHTRLISAFGGLTKIMPIFSCVFMVTMLSSIGLPGLNGFIGEFLILLSAFRTHPVYGALASTAVVLGAVYMLWMFQRVMFGPLDKDENRLLPDLNIREVVVFAPLIVLMFLLGFYPNPILDRTEASSQQMVHSVLSPAPVTPENGTQP